MLLPAERFDGLRHHLRADASPEVRWFSDPDVDGAKVLLALAPVVALLALRVDDLDESNRPSACPVVAKPLSGATTASLIRRRDERAPEANVSPCSGRIVVDEAGGAALAKLLPNCPDVGRRRSVHGEEEA